MLLKPETKPLWVTSREARKLLGGITERTLYTWRKAGKITAKRPDPNGVWLYLYADLERK